MMHKDLVSFIKFIKTKDGIGNKSSLISEVQKKFKLTKDRSVYYSKHFSVRFSYSTSSGFSNTIISLSNLQKYDDQPFFVCLVTPLKNILYLANTTFLQKISHSSQRLRIDNIRGSINGSDITKKFGDLANSPENFDKLFSIHAELGFDGNLARLVEATTNISPSGKKFKVSTAARVAIKKAPERAMDFVQSKDYMRLKAELDAKVDKYRNEILIAGFIENVNIRGRIIEYLIVGDDEKLRDGLVKALHDGSNVIPGFRTKNGLADYIRTFNRYDTATDVKTKIMVLSSNPKGYNIDKLLEFLATDKSVFMFYFIGITPNKIVDKILISMFQVNLLRSTILLKHWAGRNSRGVTQFEGETIHKLILSPNNKIDKAASGKFLITLIEL
ncbi:MAG: hypothetical protein A3J59_02740 [Candidatus Buchananbacteria bacterium RIFCSPHIGHO2_02_FULL_56_16]|uniref:Uncharacterized protein n=1 Tax=Candidatus Buchananbacteria bacterium RIFCSPHIGHO2_02_FULL_56_16 TaxID=1797542 RepID=A0A1G1YG31_9BACT|nr:MAG: hypothetical protein A3J59_02740 [Candidatus Buchananbacteria bacterium RIFCSPHIGHO2_02_FULL_56_16]